MTKKIVLILVLAVCTTGVLFSQANSGISVGGGGYFTGEFGKNSSILGGGGFGFFDAIYMELSAGFFYGNFTIDMGGFGNWSVSVTGLDFAVLGKYPIDLSNRLSLFPLLGGGYRLALTVDGETLGAEDLKVVWFKGGVGLDYYFTDNLFLRSNVLYGLRLPYKDDTDKTIGHGPDIKIGVGYKFGSKGATAPRQTTGSAVQSASAAQYSSPTVSAVSTNTYIVSLNEQNYGPYDIEQLRVMIQQGTITRDTLILREGMSKWAIAGAIPELSSAVFSGNNPPTLPPVIKYSVALIYDSYDMDQLRQMVQQGTLTKDTPIWREGMSQWATAGTIPELSLLFGESTNSPTLPLTKN